MELTNAKVKYLSKKTLFKYLFRGKFQNTRFYFNLSVKFSTSTVFSWLRYCPTAMNATEMCEYLDNLFPLGDKYYNKYNNNCTKKTIEIHAF